MGDDGAIFLRKGDESEDDKWDDSDLVKAYDKAIAKAKRSILKKVQGEFGLTNEDIEEELCSDSSGAKKKKKRKKKNKKTTTEKEQWVEGNACRAIYSVDGEEYEAKIKKIVDANWCVVKFIGYDNEEEVLLEDLMPSLGKNVVKLQKEQAEAYNAVLEDLSLNGEPSPDTASQANGETYTQEQAQRPAAHDPRTMYPPWKRNDHPHTPPAPPIPPNFGSAFYGRFMNGNSGLPRPHGEESYNAMMMSWYMCGYYTGYYQRELQERKSSGQY